MVDQNQFTMLVIIPALKNLGLFSNEAMVLLLRTAMAESNLTYLKQLGIELGSGGIGFYQMEVNTHDDIHTNFLSYRKDKEYFIEKRPAYDMAWDLHYATQMARLHYLRVADPIPEITDMQGHAEYWKDHYNTKLGKGTVERFIEVNEHTNPEFIYG